MAGKGGARRRGASLGRLAAASPGATVVGDPAVRVTGAAHAADRIAPGDLFVALPGTRHHGVEFVCAAVRAGAVAVLVDDTARRAGRFDPHRGWADLGVPVLVVTDVRAAVGPVTAAIHGDPAGSLTMVGVTGTNGKTTTTHLVEAALRADGRTVGLIGTQGHRAGRLVWPRGLTSPDAPDLQAILAAMRDEGAEVVAMECSSHALDQRRLDGIGYDVVAFTNLSREHLEYHGSMEEYYLAKARLFEPERAARGVVVVDDEWGRRLAREARIPVTTLAGGIDGPAGPAHEARWRVVGDVGSDEFDLVGPEARLSLRSHLSGEHNRVNTAVAALILLDLGLRPVRVCALLAEPVEVPGRMQWLDLGPGAPAVLVDFAHTPDGIRQAARSLRRRVRGRLVITVAAGGERDQGKRRPIGREAVFSGADVLVVTDDHPRSEDPAAIRASILEGIGDAVGTLGECSRPRVIEVAEGRRCAMEVALRAAGEGGTVGFFGLGADRHQHIGSGEACVPFVEVEEIGAAWDRVRVGHAFGHEVGEDHPSGRALAVPRHGRRATC